MEFNYSVTVKASLSVINRYWPRIAYGPSYMSDFYKLNYIKRFENKTQKALSKTLQNIFKQEEVGEVKVNCVSIDDEVGLFNFDAHFNIEKQTSTIKTIYKIKNLKNVIHNFYVEQIDLNALTN